MKARRPGLARLLGRDRHERPVIHLRTAHDDRGGFRHFRPDVGQIDERLGHDLHELEREAGSIERARFELGDRAAKGLSGLGPVAIESLIGGALARNDTNILQPVIVGDIVGSLAPRARRQMVQWSGLGVVLAVIVVTVVVRTAQLT